MPFLTLADNTSLYYKDWGNPTGLPVVFSHGWPLNRYPLPSPPF